MTTISASPLPPVSAAPPLYRADARSASQQSTSASDRPAVIVSISAEAQQKFKPIIPIDMVLRDRGVSKDQIAEFKAAHAPGEARSIAEDRARGANLEQRRQQDLETALVERSTGAPQALIDAVRGIKDVVGSVGSTNVSPGQLQYSGCYAEAP